MAAVAFFERFSAIPNFIYGNCTFKTGFIKAESEFTITCVNQVSSHCMIGHAHLFHPYIFTSSKILIHFQQHF